MGSQDLSAYYNENDPQKAAWLRELIRQNVVTPGEVDERSIEKVEAADLEGFRQCHFFAGIGVWSYALRLAGWPDDRPVWTGSCPCPSFSAAGKGGGFDDPRHLWPAWYRLIPECNPPTIFGEQADDAIGYGWLDLVQTDLERASYAVGKAVLGACSVGAPHIRQRLYFSAHAENGDGRGGECREETRIRADGERRRRLAGNCVTSSGPAADGRQSGNGHVQRSGKQRLFTEDGGTGDGQYAEHAGSSPARPAISSDGSANEFMRSGESSDGGNSLESGLQGHFGDVRNWRGPGWLNPIAARSVTEAGATRGFWADCDWWHARDEKYRPIEPGIFPLVTGAANRVLKLRGYGDAIVPQVAAEFIRANS